MKNRTRLKLWPALMLPLWLALSAPGAGKPNIIVILADDLGYADLGVQGCKDIPTPHIDSIAKSGARFTQAYVSAPCCAPSRAGLLTGKYQQRFGFEDNPGTGKNVDPNFGLPREEVLLSELLKSNGYATGIVGKWHVGYKPELVPNQRGFDEFFGFLPGAHGYLPTGKTSDLLLRNTAEVREEEYLTDAFAREAVAFVRKHPGDPFFLYLSFNAVHDPLEAPPKYLDRFPQIKDEKRRIYAAMTAAMDDAVGRVLEALRQSGIEQNTLIFFLSDNGGPTHLTTAHNAPLRGEKFEMFEGGIRVPMLMQWKNHIAPGNVFSKPVVALDIYATAAKAAGIKLPPSLKLDGADLLPFLKDDKSGSPHERLYWRFVNKRAIRVGDWKLVQHFRSGKVELYNLAEDIGETANLAGQRPEKLRELEAAYARWNGQLMAPRFTRGGGKKDQPAQP
jgi:arylsulfatase A-like enzyme